MGKEDELVLAVRTKIIVPTPWNGIKSDGIEGFEQLVRENRQFKRRGDIEDDPNWKQVIPYLVFKYRARYFLMRRTDEGGEDRLHNLDSLGIGGHIREEDLAEKSIADWARREFKEEVKFRGTFSSEPLGLLNDDTNPVGRVHIGCVFLLKGSTDQIQTRDEHKYGMLLSLEDMERFRATMEPWSQVVYDFLKQQDEK